MALGLGVGERWSRIMAMDPLRDGAALPVVLISTSGANSDTADGNEESYGEVLDKCVSLRESSAEDAKGWTASWS